MDGPLSDDQVLGLTDLHLRHRDRQGQIYFEAREKPVWARTREARRLERLALQSSDL